MSEKTFEVKPVLVEYFCDKAECGGEVLLDQNSAVLTSHPPQYTHRCERCGEVYRFTKAYPIIDYKKGI